ncbi:MAG: cbb3-type cytochrome c oxidase subunit II [Chthoniobacterales bacterium]
MNKMPVIIIGAFLTFLSSWVGLVAYPYLQLGRFTPFTAEDTGDINPPPLSGMAVMGQRVYASSGCIYCHSQQVRQVGYGSDLERGWGARPTVARDYMRENPAFLGTMRTGPDLAHIGARQPSVMWHHQHLYQPGTVSPGSIMPSYRYLYRLQKIEGQRSANAIDLLPPDNPPDGYEVVPTYEAEALVAYLLSLNRNYPLPEAPEPPQQ